MSKCNNLLFVQEAIEKPLTIIRNITNIGLRKIEKETTLEYEIKRGI